jgi:hypothetical protein
MAQRWPRHWPPLAASAGRVVNSHGQLCDRMDDEDAEMMDEQQQREKEYEIFAWNAYLRRRSQVAFAGVCMAFMTLLVVQYNLRCVCVIYECWNFFELNLCSVTLVHLHILQSNG